MRKNRRMLAGLLAACLLLGGCTPIDLRIQTQLVPPGLTGEQASIQAAFEDYLRAAGDGSEVSYRLQFPTAGEHRAAFILEDLDGDKQEEAVVFYLTTAESTDIHMNILCQTEESWTSVADIASGSSTVQEIRFGNIYGDGANALFVGWSIGSTRESSLRVYRFRDGTLTECYRSLYSRLIVSPVSTTTRDDILLLHLKTGFAGSAELITVENEVFQILSATAVDGSVIRYTADETCVGESGMVEIYADGRKENGMITELLLWNGTALSAPLYKEVQGGTAASFRSGNLAMTDVDGDAIPEWPVIRDAALTDVCVVDWMRWDAGIGAPAADRSSYVCVADGYMWLWPESWSSDSAVSYDASSRTMTVYSAEQVPLFTVQTTEEGQTVSLTEDCPLDVRTVKGQLKSF